MTASGKLPNVSAPSNGGQDIIPPPNVDVGKVIEAKDRRAFVFSLSGNIPIHYGDYVQVEFDKDDKALTVVGQVELIVGEGVKVGLRRSEGGFSLFGIDAKVDQIRDIESTRVRATARIIAFLDHHREIWTQDPTIGYMTHDVHLADKDNLVAIFSRIDNQDLEPLAVGYLPNARLPNPNEVIPVAFNPSGLMRHTAWFGQSGSGKSFSFGILLEELLFKTAARILAIDANSDLSRIDTLRSRSQIAKHSRRHYGMDEHEELQRQLTNLKEKIIIFSPDKGAGSHRLCLRFGELTEREQASLLGLDPFIDREEYNMFRQTRDGLSSSDYGIDEFVASLATAANVEKLRLQYRVQNSGIDQMPILKLEKDLPSMLDTLNTSDWKFASLDVRELSPLQRSLVTAAVLEKIYMENIKKKEVTFVVIDEAHNFCPRQPWHDHQKEPLRVIQEIASEGRKYGVFLIILSQNPSKISEQVLSQCDNLVMMKMNSEDEVDVLGLILGNEGPEIAQSVFALRKGEAICCGSIVRAPTRVKFDLRKTEPGGEDLSKEWARRRLR